jgi:hypothetical protein
VILSGQVAWDKSQILDVLRAELTRESAGRDIDWYDDKPDKLLADRVEMVLGVLRDMHHHVADVVEVESAFIVALGDLYLSGHVDLLYRPRDAPDTLALADWKTGANRPDQIELDHSWEAGVYAAAVQHGWFLPRTAVQLHRELDGAGDTRGWTATTAAGTCTHTSRYMAERVALESALISAMTDPVVLAALPLVQHQSYPTAIRYVHLGDYVPYQRAGTKAIERADDLRFYTRAVPGRVSFVPGQRRGPAWLDVRQTAADIPRLTYRLKTIVGTIRMGRFIDMVSARCGHCPFKDQCLTNGYQAVGDERRELESRMRDLPLDTTDLG